MLLRLEDPDLGGMDWNNDRYAKEWTLERRALFNGVKLLQLKLLLRYHRIR